MYREEKLKRIIIIIERINKNETFTWKYFHNPSMLIHFPQSQFLLYSLCLFRMEIVVNYFSGKSWWFNCREESFSLSKNRLFLVKRTYFSITIEYHSRWAYLHGQLSRELSERTSIIICEMIPGIWILMTCKACFRYSCFRSFLFVSHYYSCIYV